MKIFPRLPKPDTDVFSSHQITIPSQAFTPRQILEQFARNEVLPSQNVPSDIIDDEHYSEEQMQNIVEFEDEFEAEQFIKSNDFRLIQDDKQESQKQQNDDTKMDNSIREGDKEASTEA